MLAEELAEGGFVSRRIGVRLGIFDGVSLPCQRAALVKVDIKIQFIGKRENMMTLYKLGRND
jgi:hypothetical protein